ncbi:MAG TPA: hypothetical protein VJ938_07970 [Acidimicrobiia bacterium]|nr:hypothetical protein [Acidimicrobiia bacterium]
MLNDPAVAALLLIGLVGLVVGLVGGFLAGAQRLLGAMLMGAIGAVTVAAVANAGGAPPIASPGRGFSYVYGALGGLLLSYVVGRSDRRT